MNKINLSLLKEFVENMEASISVAEDLQDSQTEQGKNVSIIELSKAAGLAAGIMQEASLLILDIQTVVKFLQMPPPPQADNILNQIPLPSNKGNGNTGNMN
jgi:hypothetical protein